MLRESVSAPGATERRSKPDGMYREGLGTGRKGGRRQLGPPEAWSLILLPLGWKLIPQPYEERGALPHVDSTMFKNGGKC